MTYIQTLKDFGWFIFSKIKTNYLSKELYLRSLVGFWIHLSLNRYPLTCRVTAMYCMIHIQDPIIINSNVFTSYSDIFSHSGIFRTQDIFRTLSRHILVYSEHCVTLAYWEPKAYSESSFYRYIQAYSIISFKITLTFFFLNFNLAYFSIKFKKHVFLTKMT